MFRSAPLILLCSACAAAPEAPLELPPLSSGVLHFAGTVLSGPRRDPEAAEQLAVNDAPLVRCRVTYLADLPGESLDPLAAHTRLVVSGRGQEPLLPTARLALGARFGSGETGRAFLRAMADRGEDRARPAFDLLGVLPEGITVSFHAESEETVFVDGIGAVRRRVAVLISREDQGLSAALMVQSSNPDIPAGTTTEVLERQVILLEDTPVLGGDPLVLVFPSPFDGTRESAFVAEITVEPSADDAEQRNAALQCMADLQRSGELAGGGVLALPESRGLTLSRSLSALDLAEHHRATLVFITSTNTAPLALDLALSADPTTLAAVVQAFLAETGTDLMEGGASREDLGWDLDRAAWTLLARRLDEGGLSTALRAVLALHAGEAGRLPGTILAALEETSDRASFQEAILFENLDHLGSSDPAARVRAFDWLQARDAAPAGYDPLAPRQVRRDALDRDPRGAGR